MSERDDEPEPPEPPDRRAESRRARREAGVDSSRLALTLMKLPASALPKLGLDDDLRNDIVRARAITSMIARRRAERSLAGSLRRVDTTALAARVETVLRTGLGDPGRLHQAERWRARLIDEADGPGTGLGAFRAAYPTGNLNPLPRLIENARSERATTKPPGASRALFRHISSVMEAAAVAAAAAAAAAEDGAPGFDATAVGEAADEDAADGEQADTDAADEDAEAADEDAADGDEAADSDDDSEEHGARDPQ